MSRWPRVPAVSPAGVCRDPDITVPSVAASSLDHGIRPSLSIDVETNQPTDMFTQMRACFALQRMFANEASLFGGAHFDPAHVAVHRATLLNVRDVLEFATIEGARANGLTHKTGSLTPGKEADIILLRATETIGSMNGG